MASLCRVCRQPSKGSLCGRCFATLYPDAAARSADTTHAHALARTAKTYEQAREADELDADAAGKAISDAYEKLMSRLG